MMSKRTSTLLSAVAALALLATTGPASATCLGCTITGGIIPPGPLTPLNLGMAASPGFQSAAPIINPGDNISSIIFSGGSPNPAGLYAGSDINLARSPFPVGPFGNSLDNYLAAEPGHGTVTINFLSPQTTFDMLWGTVDFSPDPGTYNRLTNGTQSINGQDIATALGIGTSGVDNAWVELAGLAPFTSLTFTASNTAFEFDPAAPHPAARHDPEHLHEPDHPEHLHEPETSVPEPGSLALLGTALAGLGLFCRRRRKSA